MDENAPSEAEEGISHECTPKLPPVTVLTKCSALTGQESLKVNRLCIGPVRVFAVSQLKSWTSKRFRGKRGYSFRAVVHDGSRMIDCLVWHSDLHERFTHAMSSSLPILLDNVASMMKTEDFLDRYFCSLQVVLHIFSSSHVSVTLASHLLGIPTIDQVSPLEFRVPPTSSTSSTSESVFSSFYAFDRVEAPKQSDRCVKMPCADHLLRVSNYPPPTQAHHDHDQERWEEDRLAHAQIDSHPIQNCLPFHSKLGARYHSCVDKAILKHGMAYEIIYPDTFPETIHGRGIVIRRNEGNVAFLQIRGQQTRPVAEVTNIVPEVTGFLHTQQFKDRIAIRLIPPKEFHAWRAALHSSVYTLMGEIPPAIEKKVVRPGRKRAAEGGRTCLYCGKNFPREDHFKKHLLANDYCMAKYPDLLKKMYCKLCPSRSPYVTERWFKQHVATEHPTMDAKDLLMATKPPPISHKEDNSRAAAILPSKAPVNTPGSLPQRDGVMYDSAAIASVISTWETGQAFSITYSHKEDNSKSRYTSEGVYMGLENSKLPYARYMPSHTPIFEEIDCSERCDVFALVPRQQTSRKVDQSNDTDQDATTVIVTREQMDELKDLIQLLGTSIKNGLSEQTIKQHRALCQFIEDF